MYLLQVSSIVGLVLGVAVFVPVFLFFLLCSRRLVDSALIALSPAAVIGFSSALFFWLIG